MKFSINREELLEPLQLVSGVVERRQTLPVLSNLLCAVEDGRLTLTGTDQEVELSATTESISEESIGEITVPARKLMDICRSLPGAADVQVQLEENRLGLQCGRFKSHLATLPAVDFPKVEIDTTSLRLNVSGNQLASLLEKTSFAMAQQDVRYFFNGLLMEIDGGGVRGVATNGQRLAISDLTTKTGIDGNNQFIVPRKGVIELARLIKDVDQEEIELQLTSNHLRVTKGTASLTTKLIDGTYPDYNRAIPEAADKLVVIDRREFKDALSRIAILSNEMYRNVKLFLSQGVVQLNANNPMQEEAEESINVDYDGEDLEIGFNVGYLIDVLNILEGAKVEVALSDSNSAALLTDPEDESSRFVVSPMML